MFIVSLLLSGIGLTILYALSPELFYHQLWAVVLGVIVFAVIRRVDQETLKRLWWLWYLLSILFLIFTFNAPAVRGSHRWIELFGQSIQPSEVMKPLIILAFAGYLSTRRKYHIAQFIMYSVLFAIPVLLVLKQPDLGNSIVYLSIYLSLLFVSNFPLRYYIIPVVGLSIFGPIAWPWLKEYQRLRIITFLNPEYDLQGAGYNAYQALIAVGSGGWFGKGLGEGTQSGLAFLPEFHTDFIFAASVEQIGMIGGIIIIFLFACLLFTVLLSMQEGNMFVRMVVWGFFAQLMVQIIINIGMNTGLVPITGITLPLFSFGGSSVVATFLSLGIMSSFHTEKKQIIAIR